METTKLQISKDGLLKYLNDISMLESKAYAIKLSITAMKQKIEDVRHDKEKQADREVSVSQNSVNSVQREIEREKENLEEYKKDLSHAQEYLLTLEERNIQEARKAEHERKIRIALSIVFFVVGCGLLVIAYWLFFIIQEGKKEEKENAKERIAEMTKKIKTIEGNIQQSEARLNTYRDQLTSARIKLDIAQNRRRSTLNTTDPQIIFFENQITTTKKQLELLRRGIQQLYQLGYIPPDYRQFDCVLTFAQIFRNNLADNMREAVKIYEERVFRGEVIRGIDRIYSMLGKLSGTMSYISNTLSKVQSDVSMMSQDVYQISQRVSDMRKQNQQIADTNAHMAEENRQALETSNETQNKLLEETRLNRYATEALKESNDKLAWYEEQRRLGYL